jgi:polyisoprenoid-binding protein YceI
MAIMWKIDPAHSEIQFKVKHLMITTVTGYFRKFDCEVISETEDFNSTTSIKFTADIDSIETNNEQRDTHLKSEDFFNAEKFNEVIFVGTKYDALNNSATLYGNLTIRGITRPVKLDVEFGGIVVDPYGQKKAGFTINGRISRKEFELRWNAVTEAGSVVVSDEVKIHAEVQMVKQKEVEPVEQ